MNMVVGDEVAFVGNLTVAPPPTNRGASVKQIRNLVVGDAIVATLTNPYTDSARENTPSLSNDAVVHNIPTRYFLWLLRHSNLTNAHTTSAEVKKVTTADNAVRATLPKPNRICPNMPDFAVFKSYMPSPINLDYCINRGSSLMRLKTGRRR